MTSTNIVKLNIGGAVFQTTKSTLTRFDGFFRTLLETSVPHEKDENGGVFIDRDPQHFRFVLNFMRDGHVVLPSSEQVVQEILKEAQFYLLEGLMEACGFQFPAKATTTVRVLDNYEDMEQLRDWAKPLLVIGFTEEFSVNFLSPSNDVLFFVKKHEPCFDIFFYQYTKGWTCQISHESRTVFGVKKFTTVEDCFLSAEHYIDKFLQI